MTVIRGKGRWAYLYRVVEHEGNTIDFYRPSIGSTKTATPFPGQSPQGLYDISPDQFELIDGLLESAQDHASAPGGSV